MMSFHLRCLVTLLCAFTVTGNAYADEIRIGGTGAALGTMTILADAFVKRQPDAKFNVLPSIGSGGGIKAVLQGAIHIAVSSRALNATERTAGAVEFEYGRTPFVFATAAAGKTTGLTTQNLIDIYSGSMGQWPDGSRIRLVLRPVGDSDSEIIKAISPAMREAKNAAEQRKGMLFTVTDQETATAIEGTPGALGPTTLALLLSEKRPLKALALNGVAPDAKSLADGAYPLFKQMYIVTSPKSPPSALAFVAFVRSAAGREILQQNGHWTK